MKSLSPVVVRYALAARLGAALPAALVVAASTQLIGCADEKDPATWVKRLDDPAQRAGAIKRLGTFYEDAMTVAQGKKDDPKVKAVLDVIVAPLTATYEKGGLDEKTRKDLAKTLADLRDERTAPFMKKAFKEWEPKKSDEDVKFAAQAAAQLLKEGRLKDQAVLDELWNCFAKFRPSQTQISEAFKALADAVLAAKSPSFGPKAIAKIESPVEEKAVADSAFWQLTSIRVLADLKVAGAAKPLARVVFDPTKKDLRMAAYKALRGTPKEATTALIEVMNGTDKEGSDLLAKWPDKEGYGIAADALASIGTAEGRDAVLAQLDKVDSDSAKAAMALSLVNFPADAKSEAAFLDVYKKIGTESLLQGAPAKATLLGVSANFYDPKLTEWIIKESTTIKASEGTTESIKASALTAIIKLYEESQAKAAEDAVGKLGLPTDKPKFTNAQKAVTACKQDAACYAKILDTPFGATADERFQHVKATYMAAAYGNDGTRKELAAKLEKVKDDGLRLAIAVAIDHLAPKGDAEAAKIMDKIVEANAKAPQPADDILIKVSAKLKARAL